MEIKSEEAFSILETLKSMKGVKIKNIDQFKEKYLSDLSDAFQDTELAEQGKLKLKRFEDLIDEI